MSVTKPPPSLTGASPLSMLALHFNTSIQHIQLETVLVPLSFEMRYNALSITQ